MRHAWLAGFAALLLAAQAQAEEIRVLSGGAAQEAVLELAEAFKKKTGHEVKATFGPMGVIAGKLNAGEKAEILFMTGSALDGVVRDSGKLMGERRPLGHVMIGAAVKEGTPLPDMRTVEEFKQALLKAKSIVYVDPATGATSGTHFARMLDRMGIAEQVKAKTHLKPGGYVVEMVAKGEAEIGIHQISEILPVKGVKLVGPIPAEVNLVSTYIGVLVEGASPAAKAFLDFAVSAEARKIVEHGGLAPGGG